MNRTTKSSRHQRVVVIKLSRLLRRLRKALKHDSCSAGTHAPRDRAATPLTRKRQEADAAEVVAQEYVLLHADKARRRGRT